MINFKNDESIFDVLSNFVKNGGLMDADRPPKVDEPFYDLWIGAKMKHMNLKLGDEVSVLQRLHNGQAQVVSGILISEPGKHGIRLLTRGKKIWKSRENETYIHNNFILSIKKTADAKESFSIKEVNPYYQSREEISRHFKEIEECPREIKEYDLQRFANAYSHLAFSEHQILCMEFTLYWPYADGVVKNAHINIVKSDGTHIPVPETKIKHVYPNQRYHNVVGKEKKSEYVLVPFKDFESLQEIEFISCTWEIDADGIGLNVISHIYPTFEKHPYNYNIYNIHSKNILYLFETDPGFFEDYLVTNDSFAIIDGTSLGNSLKMTFEKGCPSQKEEANIMFDISDKTTFNYAEISIQHQTVKGHWIMSHCEQHSHYMNKREELVDFSKFLEGEST